ncbi:ABC transporter ATP-binding protein [Variovorax arabinosiphilus]|uniref:ABC transporter ATP-binding protein n=1 Tax=Variovorax arabinosiphilus TaxID=3053498 RepID=UPI002577BCF2|nr:MULTISPECIES: ATP-binding cassette domain-containing protein [unclassified Variovorax]MDM0121431.1 ATP-binding cassette domain-containing protein [Variovorax sp. J2L1-78]MDM0130492.1 ATP-binding cassette domain-containing protein [Variovorax sp. J2L1-63]MDM0234194.1 ATP-binding cassette domain-containing protein [Variovorax sp. J2R1-6]
MSLAATPPILHIDHLRFAYPGDPPIAAGWSARIGAGVTLLHGDTGSGKSTLLRVLAGVLPATGGRLTLAGAALPDAAEAYRRQVFFVDPSTDAFDAMGVEECAASRSADVPFDAARWQALVDGFSLAPHLAKKMFMLSTGSKRKVWLAAALASSRPLTLLDEPTAGLDAGSMRCLWRTLAEVAQEGGRAVIVASGERVDGVPLTATLTLPLTG